MLKVEIVRFWPCLGRSAAIAGLKPKAKSCYKKGDIMNYAVILLIKDRVNTKHLIGIYPDKSSANFIRRKIRKVLKNKERVILKETRNAPTKRSLKEYLNRRH